MSSSIFVLLSLGLLLGRPMEAEAKGQSTVPAIYVFGDSTMDVGNNNYLFGDNVERANYPPYGLDYPDGTPTGRFSNGYLVADYLAMMMGFDQSPPAYLSTISVGNKLSRQANGVNFASGSSGVLDSTGQNVSISMNTQVMFMGDVKRILELTEGESTANHRLSRSIFIFGVASNDIFFFYIQNGHTNQTQSHDFISMLTSKLKNQLKRVYELGGRKFVVFGTGQLGCVPTARSFMTDHRCLGDLNGLSVLFNRYMKPKILKLQSTFPEMKVSYIDTYGITLSMKSHPEKYGLKRFDVPCCGNGVFQVGMSTCMPNSTYCSNRDEFFQWDYIHPSQNAYYLITKSTFYGSRRYTTPINVEKLVES